jgi:gliding motility-associated lipoprotein GldH
MPFSYFSKNFNLQIMKKIIFLMLSFASLISCTKKEVFSEFEKDLPENRWNEKDMKTYDFEISDATKDYNLFFKISHVFGSEMSAFPIDLKITQPDGSILLKIIEVNLENTDCLGDICDSKINIVENFKFMQGKYKIEMSPKSKFGFVPNIIGIGLSVEIKE